jgi:hypothetical protein
MKKALTALIIGMTSLMAAHARDYQIVPDATSFEHETKN